MLGLWCPQDVQERFDTFRCPLVEAFFRHIGLHYWHYRTALLALLDCTICTISIIGQHYLHDLHYECFTFLGVYLLEFVGTII